MKITKKQLKQIIEEELKRLAEGEVIDTDFEKNPYKGTNPPTGDSAASPLPPAEATAAAVAKVKEEYRDISLSFKGMMGFINDVYLDAESIVEYARQNRLKDIEQIEADMLEITNGLVGLLQGLVKES